MIEELILKPIITDINPNNKTISVLKESIIYKDGIEIARQRHRCAFVPGDIKKVKAYMNVEESPEITYLNSIWTREAIAAYDQLMAANNEL